MSSTTSQRLWGKAIAIASTILLLGGCADATADPTTGTGAQGDMEVVKVGVIPVADFVPVFIAQREGFFEDEGLDVEVQISQNAASITPSVLNGQLQFGTAASTPFISAVAKGLPIAAVANTSTVSSDPKLDVSSILAMPESGIERPRDLVGKTVAVNALAAISQVTAAGSIEKDGGDLGEVTFVAMPFPEMLGALERGTVDAAVMAEPFYAQGIAAGANTIVNPNSDTLVPGTCTLMFTSQQFASQNPDVVGAFQRAINRASLAGAADPALVKSVLESDLNLSAQVLESMRLPVLSDELSVEALQHMADLMHRLGFLEKDVDASSAIWAP